MAPAAVFTFPPSLGGLAFHPLADLFPLIEGKEFQDLIASVRENGLLDPIVLLDGTILDGRNRYRACRAASVEPRYEQFTGDSPAKFVAAKNIHRRNLTTNERALIAAAMAGLVNGSNQFGRLGKGEGGAETPPSLVSLNEAADLMGVARGTVVSAKTVLDHGSETDIAAARKGAGLRPMADKIRSAFTPDQRRRHEADRAVRQATNSRASEQRVQTQQMHAEIWERLKAGLEALTGLPLPSDVVTIVNGNPSRRRQADEKCAAALKWLSDFVQQWESRDGK